MCFSPFHLNSSEIVPLAIQTIDTSDPLLDGEWKKTMALYCSHHKPHSSITDLLDECIKAFAELGSDDEDEDGIPTPMVDSGEETPWGEEVPDVDGAYDPFDSALMSPTALAKREEQEKMLADHQQKQIKKTMKNIQISDIIQTMQGAEIKDHSKEADKTLKCVFYLDGFTIDEGPLLSLEDPKNQRIIQAFKQGFVPVEYSHNSREVDVHVIWEDVTFEQKKHQIQKQKLEEDDEMDDLFFQQQLAQIAEMERSRGPATQDAFPSHAHQQNPSVPSSATTSSSTSAPAFSPPQRHPQAKADNSSKYVESESRQEQKAFTGSGKTLAENSMTDVEDTSIIHKKHDKTFHYEANSNADTTNIQFRVGSNRIVGIFNLDTTVGTLMDYIAHHEECPHAKFRLLQTYPRRSLSNRNETLREAGLKNAALMVHEVQ